MIIYIFVPYYRGVRAPSSNSSVVIPYYTPVLSVSTATNDRDRCVAVFGSSSSSKIAYVARVDGGVRDLQKGVWFNGAAWGVLLGYPILSQCGRDVRDQRDCIESY